MSSAQRLAGRFRGRNAGWAAGIVAVVGLVTAGVAAAATMQSTSHKATVDTLIIANAVKVDTLDPAQNSVNESIWLDQNIWARLVQPNADGTKILPDIATSWKVSYGG